MDRTSRLVAERLLCRLQVHSRAGWWRWFCRRHELRADVLEVGGLLRVLLSEDVRLRRDLDGAVGLIRDLAASSGTLDPELAARVERATVYADADYDVGAACRRLDELARKRRCA